MTNTQNNGGPDPVESNAGEGVIEEEGIEDAAAEPGQSEPDAARDEEPASDASADLSA